MSHWLRHWWRPTYTSTAITFYRKQKGNNRTILTHFATCNLSQFLQWVAGDKNLWRRNGDKTSLWKRMTCLNLIKMPNFWKISNFSWEFWYNGLHRVNFENLFNNVGNLGFFSWNFGKTVYLFLQLFQKNF